MAGLKSIKSKSWLLFSQRAFCLFCLSFANVNKHFPSDLFPKFRKVENC